MRSIATTVWNRRVRTGLVGLALLVVFGSWAAAVATVRWVANVERAEAMRDSDNLARVVAEQVELLVLGIDQHLIELRALAGDTAALAGFAERLRRDVYRDKIVQMSIIGADGFLEYSDLTSAAPRTVDLSDREHFKVHRDASGADGLFISRPVLGRTSGKWSIQFTRPIPGPGNSFGGVAVISIDPGYFSRFFASIDVGTEGVITLIGLDGVTRARYSKVPADADPVGKPVPEDRPYLRPDAPVSGTFSSSGPFDGVARHFSYHKIGSYPIATVVGRSEREMTEGAAGLRKRVFGIVAISTLLVAVIAFGLWRMLAVEEKLAEKLEASEARFRNYFDLGLIGMAITSPEKGWVHFNDRLCEILGYDSETLSRKSWAEMTHPEDLPADVAQFERVLNREIDGYSMDKRFVRGDGKIVHAAISVKCVRDAAGKVDHFVAIVQDITDRVQAEEALRHSQRAAAIGQLTGGVAHDFNNLLAVVLLHLELLKDRLYADPSGTRFADAALAAARRGAELTQRLLAFGRRQMLKPEAVDLGDLTKEMAEVLRRTLGETVTIVAELAREPVIVWADRGNLESAILNVALNARDAMPTGGKLTLSAFSVRAKAGGQGEVERNFGALSVIDSGTGMSDEVQARAIEPFFTTKEVGKGSGLGLSMVHGFAGQSGGRLEIESKIGSGTKITIYLPLAPEAYRPRSHDENIPAHNMRGVSALLVEDDPMVRDAIKTVLEALGCRVLTAADTEEAWLRIGEEPGIGLVLTDLVLPGGIDGLALARELRRRRPDIKAILMSGYSDELPVLAEGEPEFAFIGKPFNRAALVKALAEIELS